jgi:hypothetical protein
LVVTVKAAVAKSAPGEPVTVTTYNPGAAVPETVKLLSVNCPSVRVQVGVVTMFVGEVATVHVAVSPVLKPLPVIVTPVKTGPESGERARDGLVVVTMKAAPALSPVLPVTVTVTVPGAIGPTLKLVAWRVPVDVIVQVFGPINPTMLPLIVHGPASFGENP